MGPENDPGSDQPHQKRQRRITPQRRSKRMRDEVASEEAARSSLTSGDAEEPTASLEAGEQEAAASRGQELEELQDELSEIKRADRARETSTSRCLNGNSGLEQGDAVPDSPLESSPPHVSGPDPFSSGGPEQRASLAKSSLQSTEPEEVNNPHDNDETNKAENAGAPLPGTRWISQQDHLDHEGEKVWVVDKNGDCVIAQPKKADSTPEPAPEGAVP